MHAHKEPICGCASELRNGRTYRAAVDVAHESVEHTCINLGSSVTTEGGHVDLEYLSHLSWVINQDGCGFRDTLRRRFDAAHLPFNVAVDALDSELRLSLVARGVGIGLVTPVGLKRSAFRAQLKQVKVRDFKPKVRAWLVHRAPAGRLVKPIKAFRDRLDRELQALAR